tara:strand:+ start:2054 stop:2335 length:282 start_codon:yes stop_codon:yes gene_type:complete
MNQNDRAEFELIHNKIDNIKSDIEEIKKSMDVAHNKTDENLKFIKENLFNPHEGLWAETKLNSQFRSDTKKWRTMITTALVAVFGRWVYEFLG